MTVTVGTSILVVVVVVDCVWLLFIYTVCVIQ